MPRSSEALLLAIHNANAAAHRYQLGRQPADLLAWNFAWRRVHLEAERANRGAT
jgi:hypothetical protein